MEVPALVHRQSSLVNEYPFPELSHLDLFDVGETRFLLDACAKTLETLRLHPTHPRGKPPAPETRPVPANAPAVVSFPLDCDL